MKPVQIPSFMSIGTMVIELHVFNKKKKKNIDKNVKIHFSITLDMWHFCEIFGVHLCLNMLCHVKLLKVKFT